MDERYSTAFDYAAEEARSCRDVDLAEVCDTMDLSGRHHVLGAGAIESARLPGPRRSPEHGPERGADPWSLPTATSVDLHHDRGSEPDPF